MDTTHDSAQAVEEMLASTSNTTLIAVAAAGLAAIIASVVIDRLIHQGGASPR